MPQPYKIFTIYAREDTQYLTELLGQLRPLEIAGRIKLWSDREINPGVEWEKEIVQRLDTADIILILVSAAYYNSVFIHEVEIKYALSRHHKGEARVLPVLLRPCAFSDDPAIGGLPLLPTNGKPVSDRRYWPERDDAWVDVVSGVKHALDAIRSAELGEQGASFVHSQHTDSGQAHYKSETEPLKRPSPIRRYTVMGIIGLACLFAAWWLWGTLSSGEEQLSQASPLKTDATQQISSPIRQSTGTNSFNYPMVRVAGGTFMMGSNSSDAEGDECPHSVSVPSFYIGKYEVTQAQWKSIIGHNPSHYQDFETCPVDQISWDNAQQFIIKLNAATNRKFRLPTEAEWEYAARGGNQSRGYKYAGSNTLDDVGWYDENSGAKPHSVGEKDPNELGLHDMSGNVFEWCQDMYAPYPSCPRNDKLNSLSRVLRGGCWGFYDYLCRTSMREGRVAFQPGTFGIRLAED